ncbi:MAG: serine/threonine protein kinase [Gammaproteobacteria bacterium]|nr:MAG: serine/threonine protein kinase [Gammaproteobacteria bacterium]
MLSALDEMVADAKLRLSNHLKHLNGYADPVFIDSGGSSALFRVQTPTGFRALKVYAPNFVQGPNAKAEKARLELQRSLIGHKCPTLVDVFAITEAEETAFVEMEFIPWKSLKKNIATVPDECVPLLLEQLVHAVTYLESRGIVHRDIKPENIHVSDNFKELKLIDLGVAREFAHAEEESADATDHGAKRPFIATAQYSSPEYLFRLDSPSPDLWRGLNFYQVGAVLHDMVMKRPIFQAEVEAGNRWLVARAVLTQSPSFQDTDASRLSRYKGLSARCLTKDLTTRLSIVDWSDFSLQIEGSPIEILKAKLAKSTGFGGAQAKLAADGKLSFDRQAFQKRLCESVRQEMIPICGSKVPIELTPTGSASTFRFQFIFSESWKLTFEVGFEWQGGLYDTSVTIHVLSTATTIDSTFHIAEQKNLCATSIAEGIEIASQQVVARAAECLNTIVDIMQSEHPDDNEKTQTNEGQK